MDPTLTKSQAHQVFGDLYRKQRSPEAQAEVDRIVESTSDVFVRIKRIEELDIREERKKSIATQSRSGDRRRENGSGAVVATSGGSQLDKGGKVQKRSGKTNGKKSGGSIFGAEFWVKIFGGELAVWGKKTGTMDAGFMGMKLSTSRGVSRLFLSLKEDQIASALKCLRAVIKVGWEKWDPKTYNTVVIAYQFLTEFVQTSTLVLNSVSPGVWINKSIKMQKFYGMFLTYSDARSILTEELPSFVTQNPELVPHVGGLRSAMNYILSLEGKTPSLTNSILAYYALTTKKVYQWDDIVKQLDISEPIVDRYRAPESVLAMINGRIKKLRNEIQVKQNEIREIELIKKRYFKFDEGGKIDASFLDPIIEEVGRRAFADKQVADSFVKSYKAQPNRLLWVIVRDFELAGGTLLDGTVTVQSAGSSEEIIVFKAGLFRPWLEEMDAVLRSIETFNKKNNNFQYDFRRFKDDINKKSDSEVVNAFIQIVEKANKAMRNIALNLRTVISNHEMAVNAEKNESIKEKLIRTKEIPIENLEIGMRFLPHADRTLFANNRLNGTQLFGALDLVLKNIYNYLYIFKDKEIVKTLSASSKIEAEIRDKEAELKRMGEES